VSENEVLRRQLQRERAARRQAEELFESRARELYRANEELRAALARLERQARELEEARDAALQADRAKTAFLASMSHELRTPLNAVIGYSELLLEEVRDPEVLRDLGRIHLAGRHLLALINQVLDFSKIESGRLEPRPERFSVAALVEEVAGTVEPLVLRGENTLAVEVDAQAGEMFSDPTWLRQGLYNLLSNACNYTRQGRIELKAGRSLRGEVEHLFFQVCDSGVGIAAEDLARIFEEFYRARPEASPGTGLGLAITWKLCRLLGGELTAESRPGQGSTFTMWLPAKLPAPPRPADSTSLPAPSAPRRQRPLVLVIDDDVSVRELLKRHLEREGFAVASAAGGAEALRMARELLPDAVTLDLVMPDVDGWAVLRSLKDDPRLAAIPVVLLSVLGEDACCPGVAEVLAKPVDRGRLVAALRKLLGPPPRLLVVEDVDELRALLASSLRLEGWTVDEAADGQEALVRLAEAPPDLVVLDLLMPGMDGFEFLARMRQHPAWRSIPVLVLTAKDLGEEERARLEGSVQGLVRKGACSRQNLLAEVGSLVGRLAPGRS
jgi:signal transduction histidine kinase/CheY-like chemotaxis protein